MTTSRNRSLLLTLPAALTLALAVSACGAATEPDATPTDEAPASADGQADTDDELPVSGDGDADGAAGGSTMRVFSVTEAKTTEVEGSLHVVGLLIDDGSGWRLCELAAESYPPQCGGQTLDVQGLDPADLPLEESDGVRWQSEATLVGEVEGATLTVTGSPAAS